VATCTLPENTSVELSKIKSRAARGFCALATRYGLVVGLNASGTILVSRLLGPREWGIWAVGQFLYLAAQEIFGRGIPAFLIKKSEYPSAAELRAVAALQNTAALALSLLIAAAALIAGRYFAAPELRLILAATAVASFLFAWRGVPVAMLERELEFGKLALVEIGDAIVFNVAAIALVLVTHSLVALVEALLLRSILPTVFVYGLARLKPSIGCWESKCILRVTEFGFSYVGASILGMAVFSIQPFVVGPIAGARALGYVQMSASLYATLLFATAAVLRVSFSAYSRLSQWPEQLYASVRDNLTFLTTVQVPLIVFFAGLSPIWVPLVFGPQWTPMSEVILLQAPGYFLAAIFWGVLSSVLFVADKGRFVLAWLGSFGVAYAALSVVFIKAANSWLGVGAAWTICYLIATPILVYGYANKRTAEMLWHLGGKIGLGSAMIVAVWILMSSGHRAGTVVLIGCFGVLWTMLTRNQWKMMILAYVRSIE
jgi:O-antigen/teichoic acid export membrane protein